MYDSIQPMTQEEALTCDNDEARQLAKDVVGTLALKVEAGIDKCYREAFQGLKKTRVLVDRLTSGKRMIPAEIGRISKTARTVAGKKTCELAEELEVQKKFNEFIECLDKLRARAKKEVSVLVAEKLNNKQA